MTAARPSSRPAARVVCTDIDGRVLLLRWRDPASGRQFWEVPGGGIEAGESALAAALREFEEETGLMPTVFDAPIEVPRDYHWNAVRYVKTEPFYPAEVSASAPTIRPAALTAIEREALVAARWFTHAEIAALPAGEAEPADLACIVAKLTGTERFSGGNIGGALRVGTTVRRPQGPWSQGVHAVLEHLSSKAMGEVPRFLGTDRLGREVLSLVPGHTIDVTRQIVPDGVLAESGQWLRDLHRAMADFVPPDGTTWRCLPASARGRQICHLDAGAYNWVVRDGHLVGMIDWDMAGPGTAMDELAYVVWNSVPLFRPMDDDEAARRIRLLARAYGGIDPVALTRHVPARLRSVIGRIERGQRLGDPGMVNLRRAGEPAAMRAGLARVEGRMPSLLAAVSG